MKDYSQAMKDKMKKINKAESWKKVFSGVLNATLATVGVFIVGRIVVAEGIENDFMSWLWAGGIWAITGLLVWKFGEFDANKWTRLEDKESGMSIDYIHFDMNKWSIAWYITFLGLVSSILLVDNIQYNFSGQYSAYNVETDEVIQLGSMNWMSLDPNKLVMFKHESKFGPYEISTTCNIDDDKYDDFRIKAVYNIELTEDDWIEFVKARANRVDNSTTLFRIDKELENLLRLELKEHFASITEDELRSDDLAPAVKSCVLAALFSKGMKVEPDKVNVRVRFLTRYFENPEEVASN